MVMSAGQRIGAAALGLWVASALGGCEKKSGSGDGDSPAGVPGALAEAWSAEKLTVSAFTADKSGAIGSSCQSGTVSGVDVVVCTFTSEAEAKAAEAKGLEWVGPATGTALSKDKLLLGVVDRRGADPSGRTINAITKAFR